MSAPVTCRLGTWALLAALTVVFFAGCGDTVTTSSTEPSTSTTAAITSASEPRLRILNAGSTDVIGLSVIFPDSTVEFGDLAVGQTTDYLEVPGGVYLYAAYEYTLDGQMVLQRVLDWVGEVPLEGTAFTYQITLDTSKPVGQQVTLLGIEVDKL